MLLLYASLCHKTMVVDAIECKNMYIKKGFSIFKTT